MVDLTDPKVIQTNSACVRAVKVNGLMLAYVRNQTLTICKYAVSQNGLALRYVENKTEAICLCAVKQNGKALKHVTNQTEAICLCAVRQNGKALKHVTNQTDAICLCAVKQNGKALQYVKNQTDAICLCAVEEDGHALKYVKNQTETICIEALVRHHIRYNFFHTIYHRIKYPSPQLITQLLKIYPSYANTIMTVYVTNLIAYYYTCRNEIAIIDQHTVDLLYRPNNVNVLVSEMRWYATQNNAKTVFLMM
jgi:hypothetical protein